MINKIMVPLDGSKLAECALLYAEELATRMAISELVLVSVTERVQGYRTIEDPSAPTEVRLVPEGVGKMESQAKRYLKRIGNNLESRGIKVSKEVLLGNPAEELIIFANSGNSDLIVMSSHGRSGPSRWAFGSVADKVTRSVKIPVMLVRAPGCILNQ
jgi:nucleotide-binding universal stress UspA family protein